jgi:glycosyltransferase involved in cell wall biosynthesis
MVHAERQVQGWVNQHASSLVPELIPNKGGLQFIIQQLRKHREAVHLFGSPFEQTRQIIILILAVAMGLRVYLISEPYSPISAGYQNDKQQYINRLKANFRPLLYGVYGVLLRNRIEGVFAISCRAITQYQEIGVAREKIFPFGYFVPYQESVRSENASANSLEKTALIQDIPLARRSGGGRNDAALDNELSGLKVVFIGNLIARKGLDILIEAVRDLNKHGLFFSLEVYGPGDPSQFDFNQSAVRYCGLIPFGNAQAVISEYDVLVLPSRYDGWGVVVNEALMAGVPVICSDQVGAGAVIEKWQCGTIFASEDVSDLVCKLHDLLLNPARMNEMRLAARKAGASLDPQMAGQYMFDIISQNIKAACARKKPECPWYACQ